MGTSGSIEIHLTPDQMTDLRELIGPAPQPPFTSSLEELRYRIERIDSATREVNHVLDELSRAADVLQTKISETDDMVADCRQASSEASDYLDILHGELTAA